MAVITAVTMPKWGIEMTEGTITAWHLSAGQSVIKGAPLLDVETEKIVNAVDSPGSGVLRRQLAEPGVTLPVGALIGVIADAATSEAEIANFVDTFNPAIVSFEPDAPGAAAMPAATTGPGASAASAADAASETGDGESRVSPIARRLAERLGLDLAQISGSGRNGRISKEDVEAYAARQSSAPVATVAVLAPATDANTPKRVAMTGQRLTIARRLLEATQNIPHYRLAIDVDAGAVLAEQSARRQRGERVSLNDMIVRAAALALVQHPWVNAQLIGDEVLQYPHADIAIAIATSSGLITPIVRCADLKSLVQIATEIRDFAARARHAQLKREEIVGGTFTISNLGMYGVARFDAIINPPQVAILAVGAVGERVVSREGAFVTASSLTLTLSADHRVVDGAIGAAFLRSLRDALQSAATL